MHRRPLKFCSVRKILLNEDEKSSGFQCEEENKLKSFLLLLVLQEGLIKSIKGETSRSIGEAKGGVKA